MTSTRLRSVVGRSWRKTDVHACVSVSQFQNRVSAPSFGATVFVSAICQTLCQNLYHGGHGDNGGTDRHSLETVSSLKPLLVSSVALFSRFQERLRIDPLPELALEVPALVHEDLPVVGQHDARALERTRRRPFEVDATSVRKPLPWHGHLNLFSAER